MVLGYATNIQPNWLQANRQNQFCGTRTDIPTATFVRKSTSDLNNTKKQKAEGRVGGLDEAMTVPSTETLELRLTMI